MIYLISFVDLMQPTLTFSSFLNQVVEITTDHPAQFRNLTFIFVCYEYVNIEYL